MSDLEWSKRLERVKDKVVLWLFDRKIGFVLFCFVSPHFHPLPTHTRTHTHTKLVGCYLESSSKMVVLTCKLRTIVKTSINAMYASHTLHRQLPSNHHIYSVSTRPRLCAYNSVLLNRLCPILFVS